MRLARTFVYSITLFLLFQSSCKSPTDAGGGNFQDSHILGQIVRSDDNSGIPGAVVRDLTFINVADTTDASGNFDLLYSIDTKLNTRITAIATGFIDDTVSVSLDPGQTVPGVGITLGVDSSSPPPGSAYTGIAASIVQVATGPSNISIRGTGANETTVLTWEVRDSLGFPVTLAKKVTVRFSILGGPGGGEYLLPSTVDSDSKGRVSTRLNSGTTAGVVQVYATTRGDTVQSGPTKITITTGLPDQAHFSMTATKVNLPGGPGLPNGDNQKTSFTILAGDRFGNPAQAGTAIYFTTTGGVIQPTATTGSSGTATAELSTGNPRPAGGIATVTARTIGDSGAAVNASMQVVFSGATRILAPANTFTIPDSGYNEIFYQVQDINGNPLSGGSTIKASVSGAGAGGLSLSKDADIVLPDTRDTNRTNYVVRIEKNARGGANGDFDLKIEVNSPNNATGRVEFLLVPGFTQKTGTGQGGGGGGGGGGATPNPTADKMEFVGSSRQSIIVNDGANQDKSKTTLTFLVKDSVGNPLINPVDPSLSKKYVTFAVFPSDGITGGEALTIAGDSTNEFAQVSTTLLAGTKSGIFRVVATTIQSGKPPIQAEGKIIIKSGPPDATHFGAGAPTFNFPGLQIVSESVTNGITVAIGDKYGNPVEAGTRVYFNTSHGFVDPEAATNANGFMSVKLLAALPKPTGANAIASLGGPGWGVVRAFTFTDSVQLKDSVLILWTGAPVITYISGPATYTIANGGSAGPWTFTVTDFLGHPLSKGTSINVSAPGGAVSGNANTALPDAVTAGAGITSFTVSLRDADATTATVPPASGELVVTVTHATYGTFTLILATGTIQ